MFRFARVRHQGIKLANLVLCCLTLLDSLMMDPCEAKHVRVLSLININIYWTSLCILLFIIVKLLSISKVLICFLISHSSVSIVTGLGAGRPAEGQDIIPFGKAALSPGIKAAGA